MFKSNAILLMGLLSFLIIPSLGFSTIINVPNDYLTIEQAVTAASNGDTILVENGTYNELFIPIPSLELIIVSQYAFTGDPADIEATVIDGAHMPMNLFAGKIQGFTFTNSISCMAISNSPKTTGDSLVICDNIFDNNSETVIQSGSSKSLIRNNLFINNNPGISGGAIYCLSYDSSIITGNIFRDNDGGTWGGAILSVSDCYNIIENNTIIHNTADSGAGIYVSGSEIIFSRNIVAENIGGGIENKDGGTFTLSCNNVWNNTGGNGDYNGCTPVDDISADPLFCDPDTYNFELYAESPCAAANNSCGVLIGAEDVGCSGFELDLGIIPDLAVGYEVGDGVSIFIGDGVGGFGPEQNNYSVVCHDITSGYFNNDEHLDLAATDLNGYLKTYFGDGTGALSLQQNISFFLLAGIASGDFDGDTYTDLAVGDIMSNNVVIYKNNGSGNFSSIGSYPVGAQAVDIHTGLFDDNASLDLVVVNEADDDISILLNNGSGNFSNRADSGVGDAPKQVEVADFNGDTHLDLAVTCSGEDSIIVYFGDGLGTFPDKSKFLVGDDPRGIEWGHFNLDEIPDLVVTNHGDNDISILINDGSGDFSARTDYATGPGASPNDVAVGHLNDDRKLDLVVSHRLSMGSGVDIMLNDGNNQFPTTSQISGYNTPRVVLLDDFNGDSYVSPTTFHVTNLDDAGDGSLRWAITEANNNPGQDTILFDVSGTIQPLTDLPFLDDPFGTIIWGSSAPEKAGSILLDLSYLYYGIHLQEKNNTIEGLTFINGTFGIGIDINSDSNIVINNYISNMSSHGISIGFTKHNRIGGYDPDESNVIEYCNISGIMLGFSDSNLVIGNRISHISATGADDGDGIGINNSNYNLIHSNTIDSCEQNGVNIYTASQYNTLTRNQIFENDKMGIDLGDDSLTLNDTDDLDTGPNDLLNFPEIDSVRETFQTFDEYYVWGHAAPKAIVEFFIAQYSGDILNLDDPSGYGEAYEFVGSDTCDETGFFEYRLWDSIDPFTKYTATATDTLGNTSEFCQNFNLIPRPFIIVGYTFPGLKRDCPSAINLRVIDPEGNRIGYDAGEVFYDEIPDASYTETADCNDSIYITNPLLGSYVVEVVAEPDALPDTYYAVGIRIDGSDETMLVVDRGTPPADSTEDYTYEVEALWHYMNGDANRDTTINIFDITFIISYLYLSGEAPWPMNAADANCDLIVNIFDITHLITYLYIGGVEPCLLEE